MGVDNLTNVIVTVRIETRRGHVEEKIFNLTEDYDDDATATDVLNHAREWADEILGSI